MPPQDLQENYWPQPSQEIMLTQVLPEKIDFIQTRTPPSCHLSGGSTNLVPSPLAIPRN